MDREEASELFAKHIKAQEARKTLNDIVNEGIEVLAKNPDGTILALQSGFEIQVGGIVTIKE